MNVNYISGKEIAQFDHAHIACLLYKLIQAPGSYEDLSIGFIQESNTRAEECIANKQNHSKVHVKVFPKRSF